MILSKRTGAPSPLHRSSFSGAQMLFDPRVYLTRSRQWPAIRGCDERFQFAFDCSRFSDIYCGRIRSEQSQFARLISAHNAAVHCSFDSMKQF